MSTTGTFEPLMSDEPPKKSTSPFVIFFLVLFGLVAAAGFALALYTFLQPEELAMPTSKQFRILHFSDFYQVQGIPKFTGDNQLQLGGMSRLATIKKQQTLPHLVVFGGDLFYPSAMSTFFGSPVQMVETFNHVGIDVAVTGNHEFDQGVHFASSQFPLFKTPWLLGNFHLPGTSDPIKGTKATHVIELDGLKIGFLGLGYDFSESTSMNSSYAIYESFSVAAWRLAKQLRYDDGVDLVVALIHMEFPDQLKLVEAVPEIDLVLSGHDHFWKYQRLNGVNVVEGDINLRTLTILDVSYTPGTYPLQRQEKVTYMDVDETVAKDNETEVIVQKYVKQFELVSKEVVGSTSVILSVQNIRLMETNLANWVCDMLTKWAVKAIADLPDLPPESDTWPILSFMNAGGIRWQADRPVGNLTMGDVLELSPFTSTICLIQIKGITLRNAMENGVSRLPLSNGRFAQISGFKMDVNCGGGNCSAPVGSRISNLRLNNGTIIDDEMDLFLALNDFDLNGGDGYDFDLSRIWIDAEGGPDFLDLLLEAVKRESPLSPVVDGRINLLVKAKVEPFAP